MTRERATPTSVGIVRVYLSTSALFTLATSLIWGVNTLFLLDAGLDIFEVMVVNAAFSAGQVLCEVPTGVVADTIGRKASFLFGIATLFVSTLLYLGSAELGWGFVGFLLASALLGLGYTFQTGAVDAWLVDALDYVGDERPRETVFARGGMVFGVSMLIGTLAGGFLGQVDLALPFVVRAGILIVAFAVTVTIMREVGFEPRPLRAADLGKETRRIAEAGVRFGWRDPVVRPLLLVSALQGTFMMYFFYASQPYALDLLGRRDLVWVAGALTALFGLTGVVGNSLVGKVSRSSWQERPASVLSVCAAVLAVLVVGIGALGLLAPPEGSIAAFAVMVALFSAFGVVLGLLGPIRQAFINKHIPSAQRATVLSLDSFFADAGGAVGQPGYGWIARAVSIPVGYLLGAAFIGVATPLYRVAGRAAREKASNPMPEKNADAG